MVTINSDLDSTTMAAAQKSDPVLDIVLQQLTSKKTPSSTGNWRKFPLKRFRQIWSKHQSVLYRKVNSPTMQEEKLLFIVPTSLQQQFLKRAHDESGHQGADRTMVRLSEAAYWVGIGRDVSRYCNRCLTCQRTKAPATHPAPLQPVVARRPWELVAVDVLKVPMSHQGSQYIFVVQGPSGPLPYLC